MRALVVDDELPAREELGWLLSQCNVDVVSLCASSEEALVFLENTSVDVVFLDIEMPGLNGMRLGEILHDRRKASLSSSPSLIFVTAYQEKAVDAFEIEATDYLLKPVRLERLRKAIEKVKSVSVLPEKKPQEKKEKEKEKKLTRISVEHRGAFHVVSVNDILVFESQEGIVIAYTENENFVTDFSLKFLEANLDTDYFFRCHRSYIVRIDRITRIAPWGAGTFQLTLENTKEVPLARKRASELRALMPATMASFGGED